MPIDVPPQQTPDAPARRMSRYWVVRERVLATLASGLDNQLVVLRAPRGAGKSVAVRHLADRVRHEGRPVHLVGGVARECGLPDALRAVLRLGDHEGAPAADSADALATRTDILIIDDFEFSADDEAHLIDFLTAAPGLTVVVTTRHRTGLEKTSVAVRVDTHLVDPAVLTFDDDDTAALLEKCDVTIDPVDASVIRERLDGHAAAIHLAVSALRFHGAERPRTDDVLRAIEHALTEFAELCADGLASTGVDQPELLFLPPYLNPGSVAALCHLGETASVEVLAALDRAGLGRSSEFAQAARFDPLPVLRCALWREGVAATSSVEVVDALIAYMVADGDPQAACEVALAAQRWEALVEVLGCSFERLYEHDPVRVAAILRAVPAPFVEARPELAVRAALVELDAESSRVRLNQLERLVRTIPSPNSDSSALQVVRTLTVQTTARRRLGQYGRAAESAERLADPVGRLDSAGAPGAVAAAALALYESGLSLMHMKRVREARWRFADVRRRAPGSRVDDEAKAALALLDLLHGEVSEATALLSSLQHSQAASAPVVRVARAFAALERNDVAAASRDLDALDEQTPHHEYWVISLALRAWLKLFAGETNAAVAVLRHGQSHESFVPVSPQFGSFLQAARADALVAVRQAPSALAVSRVPEFAGEITAASLTRALLQTGQDAQVTWLASQRLAKNAPSPRVQLELLLVRACACVHLGQDSEAVASLVQAESVTREHGVRTPWRFIAADDRERLRAIAPAAVVEMLDADPPAFHGSLALPRLSRRESLVLARLRTGGSVVQIAKDLMVSSNTVKTQLRSVYRKLGVSNRSEAVRAAIEWGLLQDPAGQLRQAP